MADVLSHSHIGSWVPSSLSRPSSAMRSISAQSASSKRSDPGRVQSIARFLSSDTTPLSIFSLFPLGTLPPLLNRSLSLLCVVGSPPPSIKTNLVYPIPTSGQDGVTPAREIATMYWRRVRTHPTLEHLGMRNLRPEGPHALDAFGKLEVSNSAASTRCLFNAR